MIIVTDLAGNSEIVNKFSNFEMYEELNGSFTLSFTSYNHTDNPGHNLITQEGFIEYDSYKFRIKQLRRQMNSVQVSCLSTYYDNFDKYKYDIYGGTHTLSEFMNYVLADTGWSWSAENIDTSKTWAFKDVSSDPSEMVFNFGQSNVIRLMEQLKLTFGFEMRIDRDNHLTISNKLGPDNDAQYRYGYNVVSLTESIDTTKLKTYIEGFGANGLHVTYTSPYSSNPGIGIRHADPVYDDSYTDSNLLLEYLKTQITDYPESSIELGDVTLLDKSIGESVWVIHERMGIEYQTRVVSKRIKIPSSLSSVTLGTYTPQSKSIGNALATQRADIDKNNATFRSRITQTNERIELAVTMIDDLGSSSEAGIAILSDRITTEVTARQNGDTNAITTSKSYVDQTALSITSNVTTQVSRLDGRVDSSNSVISQNASEILLRVRKDGVISSINQTAESVRISASKIDITGAVTFSSLDSSLSTNVNAGVTAKGRTDNWIDSGSTYINGGMIKTGSITATQINTTNLSAEKIYQSGSSNNYAQLGGSWGDLVMYYSGAEFFRIYNSPAYAMSLMHRGNTFLSHNSFNGNKTMPQGTWDFSSATIAGLSLTAKFG